MFKMKRFKMKRDHSGITVGALYSRAPSMSIRSGFLVGLSHVATALISQVGSIGGQFPGLTLPNDRAKLSRVIVILQRDFRPSYIDDSWMDDTKVSWAS